MTTLTERPEILELADALEEFQTNWDRAKTTFVRHLSSSFLRDFVLSELRRICKDPNHLVRKNVGQVNFSCLNTDHFDYTIRLCYEQPSQAENRYRKWMGIRQVIGVSGPGLATFSRWRVPRGTDINAFDADVTLSLIDRSDVSGGDHVSVDDPYEILQLENVRDRVVLQALSQKKPNVRIHWTFDQSLTATYSEASTARDSRIHNLLRLARAMRLPLDKEVHDVIYEHGDSHLRLASIQTLFAEQSPFAFDRLGEAFDSGDAVLVSGADKILASMTSAS